MNRCRSCVAVIAGVITAGALYGGAGTALVPPASADPADSGESAGDGSAAPATRVNSNAPGPRRPGVRVASPVRSFPTAGVRRERHVSDGPVRPPPGRAAEEAKGGPTEQWWCSWWVTVEPVRPPLPAAVDNRGLILVPGPVSVSPPVTRLVGGVSLQLPGPEILSAPAAAGGTAPVQRPPVQGPPVQGPPAPGPQGRVAAERPAVVALAGPPNRSSGPSAPSSRPPSAGPAVSVRLGYPEYLRRADITGLALVALPGLAALLGLTAIGGVLGYRQAKAGYLLRAATAGRFLR